LSTTHPQHERCPGFVWASAVVLLALMLAGDLARAYEAWPQAQGWEYEWIAHAWADGKGYSFPGDDRRWLFDPSNPDDGTDPGSYYGTAWEEPVPVVLLGTFFRLFGDYGRLAMTLANALFFAATIVVVYHVGRRILGVWLGLTSAALLALIPSIHSLIKTYLGGSVLAGLLVSGCALLLLRFMERASVRRGLLLGAALGLAALTQAATVVFIPVAALASLLSQWSLNWRAWRSAGVVVGAALLVISPWAARNYATFGELVLVKNGAGLITYIGNRALAETVEPSLVDDDAPFKPPWTARSILDAMRLIEDYDHHFDLIMYAQKTVRATAADQYGELNEAQRDKLLRREALDFMWQHPLTTLKLAAIKVVKFLGPSPSAWLHLIPAVLTGLLAVIGVASSLKDSRVMALGLMALAYAGVYAVTFPFHYRYRYPIEPVLALLAGVGVIQLVGLGQRFRQRLIRASDSDPSRVRVGPSRSNPGGV
jgi:4-amino-4-deoxy-L-arabinose transferase-like glycosyltransferase